MTILNLKKAISIIALNAVFSLGIMPCMGQTLSMDIANDPQVLVSPAAQSSNNNASDNGSSGNSTRLNLETTLVDIKAVDAPGLHSKNGKIGVGSEERYGQGIIIDSAGIIATNRHIIGHAQHIFVALSGGRIFEAYLLSNSQADLCLIKINVPFSLRAVSLADPSEIRQGINVIAIANAGFTLQRKLGGQIINVFKEKSSNNIELLEMNIPLKPGDSGGPILNEEGSLLGLIMGKKISDPTKSFAVASSRIMREYFKYRNAVLN